MDDLTLVLDLVLAVLAALVGGVVARRLGQPVLLGYLLAGVALGPFTPGPVADPHTVRVLAEIGVAFLMFAVGAEFSLSELRRVGRVATLGGALQLGCTMGLGPLLAPALGLSFAQGVFLGALLALSSTVVAVKVLMARGELQALHGRVALGILIAQDLAVVPMAIVLPALAAGSEGLLTELGLAALKAAAILLGAYAVGGRLVPWLLDRLAIARTRELFLLAVVGVALGTALVTHFAGLSLAFGALLAGLVVAESEYRAQVVAEVLPLRDLFASLFFVSVGILINPTALLSNAGLVALLSGAVVLGKAGLVALVVLALGLPGRVAVLAGLSLAQVGEFSFVLARLGVDGGAIPPALFDLTLATALVTIVLTPLLLRSAPLLLQGLERLPAAGRWFAPPVDASAAAAVLGPGGALPPAPDDAPGPPGTPEARGRRRHAVVCGFGRVGRELVAALEARGVPYLVIEYNPLVVRQLRARGVPVIYGDAANPAVLEHARLDRARLLAVLIPDALAAEAATGEARRRNPRLTIVARARDLDGVDRLRRAGATAVVQPEFEAGVEVIRHALRGYGLSTQELALLTAGRRQAFYQHPPAEAADGLA
ncbi:MAG TPA: cation:proton antiporter [Chloroflexota bacterium]|nr:cation:proton antiporter [Chloroflexota bacterium]